jgi:alkylhydroperoxidase family enzyme
MARVSYVTPENAPPDVADKIKELSSLHVIGLMAHAETAFFPWLRFGGAVLNDLALDPALRELAILQVGHLAARYEWEQHVPIALAVGVTQTQIDAIEKGDLDSFAARDRAILDYVIAFVAGEVDDDLHGAVAAHLPEREIVELALVAGHYLMLARMMSALRIDSDPPAGPEALIKLR